MLHAFAKFTLDMLHNSMGSLQKFLILVIYYNNTHRVLTCLYIFLCNNFSLS